MDWTLIGIILTLFFGIIGIIGIIITIIIYRLQKMKKDKKTIINYPTKNKISSIGDQSQIVQARSINKLIINPQKNNKANREYISDYINKKETKKEEMKSEMVKSTKPKKPEGVYNLGKPLEIHNKFRLTNNIKFVTIDCDKGDIIEGEINVSGGPVDIFIFDSLNRSKYINNDNPDDYLGDFPDREYVEVYIQIKRKDIYHIIIDARGKINTRYVKIDLMKRS